MKRSPTAAELSRSGDLGYTWGTYEYRLPAADDKTNCHHGEYVTVWKKQPDGAWKFVVDIGHPSPAPK